MSKTFNPNATSVQIFKNEKFGDVRTVDVYGNIFFVGNDVAKSLGYTNPRKAIDDHCKGAVKHRILTRGGEQQMSVISEGDIYRLAARSELPGAAEFESWIFDEVLPSIRKTGGYNLAGSALPGVNLPVYLKYIESMCKNIKMSDAEKRAMYRHAAVAYGMSLPDWAEEIGAAPADDIDAHALVSVILGAPVGSATIGELIALAIGGDADLEAGSAADAELQSVGVRCRADGAWFANGSKALQKALYAAKSPHALNYHRVLRGIPFSRAVSGRIAGHSCRATMVPYEYLGLCNAKTVQP